LDQTLLVQFQGSVFVLEICEMETAERDHPVGQRIRQGLFHRDIAMIGTLHWDDSVRKYVSVQQDLSQLSRLLDDHMDFTSLGIGGLNKELMVMFRRAFISRLYTPETLKKLGCKHVKGILLYGPPGTGKTTVARKIGQILHVDNPKIVNGPELLSKYVGESEKNMRELFAEAAAAGPDDTKIHLVVFDEIDAIAKSRGSSGDNTGARDGLVTQLLSLMDGVRSLNNILVIGMTNRKELLDEALLRPGRMEIHIELGLPDEAGRLEILTVHTQAMRDNGLLGADVDLAALAHHTVHYTGAELEALVRSAQSYAMMEHRHVDGTGPALCVCHTHFQTALDEVQPAYGIPRVTWSDYQRGGILPIAPEDALPAHWLPWCDERSPAPLKSLLVHGPHGAGCTAFLAYLAQHTRIRSIKWLSPHKFLHLGEAAKARLLRETFEMAWACDHSLILVDDLEWWLDYVSPQRFSSHLWLQLTTLCRQAPPAPRNCKLVATTHAWGQSFFRDELAWQELFNATHELPLVLSPVGVEALVQVDTQFPVPIKTLINRQ